MEVNEKNMIAAAELIVGAEVTQVILRFYEALETAQKYGYESGVHAGYEASHGRLADAFDHGYELGKEATENNTRTSWDQGYLDGVSDARARPDMADQTVHDILKDLSSHALNGEYDADLVSDSGDEA